MDLKTDVAHSARMYDYYLGGKDNFPADRQAAEQVRTTMPEVVHGAVQNRAFLVRAIRYLAAEAGLRQFLDIGTGIPTSPNLHEVAQVVAPTSRLVYVDNDPIVLAHARALLTSRPEGATAYLDADFRDPQRILTAPELLETLDLTRPIGLSLGALLPFIPEQADPEGIVRQLIDALPSGSYLTVTYLTTDFSPDQVAKTVDIYRAQNIPVHPRTHDEILRFFDGLDVVDPGVTPLHRWRPDATVVDSPEAEEGGRLAYAGVARKP
ncbi:SAM-dependent methyltransferase [Pseudofrankia sp. BMG5.37]|uniref:SAM-dependent methyltransferase n=1 Tax=Pseudofrankia sp. BMG5.36 TaxID=1834512 RepID=UPI0008D91AE0|nr:SAM-dependent methyltransferase [Pseudofrankia sp. BMG5.36]MDT3438096.1 SAM-dependent methyltransferase [Pseudofrankia sp. BMG5.37]OHV56807.1 methyltransferase [Pseudofrankia sp. BMG5.36]